MKKLVLMGMLMAALTGSSVFAQGATDSKNSSRSAKSSKKSAVQITPEQRKELAEAHEEMAECLRSKKPLSKCQAEMREDCREVFGKSGCSMMDMGGTMGHDSGWHSNEDHHWNGTD